MTDIASAYHAIRESIPDYVSIVAAVKHRSTEETRAAIDAGVRIIGHNYVQEAHDMVDAINRPVQLHMLGHLQRNKVKDAARIFDMIQTLDSWSLAELLDRRCAMIGKVMPVLIEVNSGREESKTGVTPEGAVRLAMQMSDLTHVRVKGLMTMGPRFGDPECARPYFRATKQTYNTLSAMQNPNIEVQYLSMGMSNSYRVAIEEGSNMVRIGTSLFGVGAI